MSSINRTSLDLLLTHIYTITIIHDLKQRPCLLAYRIQRTLPRPRYIARNSDSAYTPEATRLSQILYANSLIYARQYQKHIYTATFSAAAAQYLTPNKQINLNSHGDSNTALDHVGSTPYMMYITHHRRRRSRIAGRSRNTDDQRAGHRVHSILRSPCLNAWEIVFCCKAIHAGRHAKTRGYIDALDQQ